MELLSPIMAPNKKRNAGRQLLITRNRLKAETNPSKKASLKRLEANLLLDLALPEEAMIVASALAEAHPADAGAAAFLGDILARTGKWSASEEQFTRSYEICLTLNKKKKAFSLASGPMFLLAEARGDYERCIQVAPSQLLRNRALRLSGKRTADDTAPPESSPWRELHLIERVHNGSAPGILRGVLDDWTAGEAEWRWRILFEGGVISGEVGAGLKQWRRYLKLTVGRVLDPRYFQERKQLKAVLNTGFVKNSQG